jgi:hypothetical protein
MRAQIAASSGRFALNREIPVCSGLRGPLAPQTTNPILPPLGAIIAFARPDLWRTARTDLLN